MRVQQVEVAAGGGRDAGHAEDALEEAAHAGAGLHVSFCICCVSFLCCRTFMCV